MIVLTFAGMFGGLICDRSVKAAPFFRVHRSVPMNSVGQVGCRLPSRANDTLRTAPFCLLDDLAAATSDI